jgi:short-chain Z-isoprenyl diphosphate synthase
MLDGNRRWARANGFEVRDGHQAGADKIKDLLHWCEEAGVEVVTLWLLSTDNLSRSPKEIVPLLQIIETAVADLAAEHRWRLHPIGALDLLPAETARSLKDSAEQTRDVAGLHVNVAVGYGGRREIADAVRAMLLEQSALGIPVDTIAENVSVEEIDAHLYTKGQPDPDLVIRTSGEQRLGGFLLWQSAKSEFYFCEAYWPDFRHVDFLRALRSYAERERRFGREARSRGHDTLTRAVIFSVSWPLDGARAPGRPRGIPTPEGGIGRPAELSATHRGRSPSRR